MAEIGASGRCRLVDPVVRGKIKEKGGSRDFHAALVTALQAHLPSNAQTRHAQSASTEDVSGMVPFPQAAFVLALKTGKDETRPVAQDELLFFVPQGREAAERIVDVLRTGRNGSVLSVIAPDMSRVGAFIWVSDSAEDYGNASSLIGRKDFENTLKPLARHAILTRDFWIELDQPTPDPASMTLLGRYCALTETLADKDFAWFDDGESQATLVTIERIGNGTPTADLADTITPLQPFVLQQIYAKPDSEAAKLLADRIADESYRLGYRVSLQLVPAGMAAGLDVGPLLEEIEELKMQINQIETMGAPQTRLLRFSEAQFPAMIDALRRLPEERLKDGSLKYAAGHSAGVVEPSHYLLYDLSKAPARVLESLWRTLDPSRPMSYWLDPFIAERGQRERASSAVFVPDNHFIVPSLAHFGGRIDETLKLVIGRLFADLSTFLAVKGCRPMYIFTPLNDEAGTIEIEALDEQSFAPLEQQLGWMNDYLQVRSPGLLDRAALRLLAEELYEGDFVNAEREKLAGTVASLSDEWRQATDQIRNDGVALINAHAAEVEMASSQIASAQAWLKLAQENMHGLERLLSHAEKALKQSERTGLVVKERDTDMIRARRQFETRVKNEFDRGERNVDLFKQRLKRLRDSVDALRWGSKS